MSYLQVSCDQLIFVLWTQSRAIEGGLAKHFWRGSGVGERGWARLRQLQSREGEGSSSSRVHADRRTLIALLMVTPSHVRP